MTSPAATARTSILGTFLALLLVLLPGLAHAEALDAPNTTLAASAEARGGPALPARSSVHTEVHTYFVAEREGAPAVWVHNACGPTRQQVRALRDMGTDRVGRRAFFRGEAAPFHPPTPGGDPTIGVIQRISGTRVRGGIIDVRDQSGSGARALGRFRDRFQGVARAFGAQEMEVGGAITNPRIAATLRRRGFQETTMPAPDAFGGLPGETIDLLSRVFRVQ